MFLNWHWELMQQERLQVLRERIQIPFDPDDPDHEVRFLASSPRIVCFSSVIQCFLRSFKSAHNAEAILS